MCGIVGVWSLKDTIGPLDRVREMLLPLQHRGPDGEGVWLAEDADLAFGHRRLAIVDLSDAGRQPMQSASKRYCVTFNGEIYNFQKMRRELEPLGARFVGHSDTEVLLAGFEQWGIHATIEKCIGMFAMGVWDRDARRLSLVRDRFGEKPLYYSVGAQRLLFASELKALLALNDFDRRIDKRVLPLYLRHNYVPSPYSIFQGVNKLAPGHILELRLAANGSFDTREVEYWSAGGRAVMAATRPFRGTMDDACGELQRLLVDAVAQQMISDVPLGAFLSGGIDSSVVVAMMQSVSKTPVRTYSIGFREDEFNEAEFGKQVAKHLGTDHTELYVEPGQALDQIPSLADVFDEPFADSSQIPTCLVARLARKHVTVALSGDGGDECFLGYGRYLLTRDLWTRLQAAPHIVRRAAAGIADIGSSLMSERMRRRARLLSVDSPEDLYREIVSHYPMPVRPGSDSYPVRVRFESRPHGADWIAQMGVADAATYLPDDIMVKVDRATMFVSLESRAPLLDHRVFEFAAALPLEYRLHRGVGKRVLKELLFSRVPRALVDRPKVGFGVPLAQWLRQPLRAWADDLLDPAALARFGLVDGEMVAKMWQAHKSGRAELHYSLWNVLMLQAWCLRWRPL